MFSSSDDYVNSVTLGHILDLLTFCVEHHTYHIKNYIISKDLLRRVLVLMTSRHKFLVLSKYLKSFVLFCCFFFFFWRGGAYAVLKGLMQHEL